MKTACPRVFAACGVFVLFAAALGASSAHAARVGILSNGFAVATATNFAAHIPGHTFTGIDTSSQVPSLATLTSSYDVLLVFEDGVFANAPVVGAVAAAFAQSGRPIILGTFYDQDRSDVSNPGLSSPPHGWGALESIDPNTTDGTGVATDVNGTPNSTKTLNAASIVAHPLTTGVTALAAITGFAGGNQAKAGTTVLATWLQPNARGLPDPAIAYRVTGAACVIQIGIAPDYAAGTGNGYGGFTGDFYTVWKNAFDFGAVQCVLPAPPVATGTFAVPTLSDAALGLTVLLIAAVAFSQRRRIVRPTR
jgi:IPTL-CTERM motif